MSKQVLSRNPFAVQNATTESSANSSFLSRIEQAFANWQAKRLHNMDLTRLWDKAMQDSRSPAAIRQQKQ